MNGDIGPKIVANDDPLHKATSDVNGIMAGMSQRLGTQAPSIFVAWIRPSVQRPQSVAAPRQNLWHSRRCSHNPAAWLLRHSLFSLAALAPVNTMTECVSGRPQPGWRLASAPAQLPGPSLSIRVRLLPNPCYCSFDLRYMTFLVVTSLLERGSSTCRKTSPGCKWFMIRHGAQKGRA